MRTWLALVVGGCRLAAPGSDELSRPDPEQLSPALIVADDPPGPVGRPDFEVRGAIVLDRSTGLEWQRVVSSELFPLTSATSACARLVLDGAGGFRVPTRSELLSIVDFESIVNAETETYAIRKDIFPSSPPKLVGEFFWTSSPVPSPKGALWTVAFFDGVAVRLNEGIHPVRCVRGGRTRPSPRFVFADDVVDQAASLRWDRTVGSGLVNLEAATKYCASRGRRVPTAHELQTIVDAGRRSPAIDPNAFPSTPREPFWSSTPNSWLDYYGWAVSFETGETLYANRDARFHVRCVTSP